MTISSVSSIPSSAAVWSALKPASPVTWALSETVARIVATFLATTSVASSLVQTVTSWVVWSSEIALIALDCGGVIGGSSPHASWTGVITRTTSLIASGLHSACASDATRSGVSLE